MKDDHSLVLCHPIHPIYEVSGSKSELAEGLLSTLLATGIASISQGSQIWSIAEPLVAWQ